MPEPLLGRPRWARLVPHDDTATDPSAGFDLVALTPGPAGSVSLSLGTLSIDFDPAQDGRVNQVVVEVWDEHTERALLRLIGPDVVGLDRSRPRLRHSVSPDEEALDPDAPQPATPLGVTDASRDLYRLALTIDRADSPGLFADERAALWLQAGVLAHRTGVDDRVPRLAPTLAAAIRRLARRPAVEPLLLGPATARVLVEVCADARQLFPARLAELGRIRDRALAASERVSDDDVEFDDLPDVGAASSLLSPDSLPLLASPSHLEITTGSADECVVVLHGWGLRARGWWVRAFRASDRLPIGVAPVRIEDGVAVGTLLVAPRHWSDLWIDVVDDAGSPRPSVRAAHLRAAVAAGQRAAAAQRRGDLGEAGLEWGTCAEHHAAAGDDDRSRAARALEGGRAIGSQPRQRGRSGTATSPAPDAVQLVGDHLRLV